MSKKTAIIQFRCSADEKEMIEKLTSANGFTCVSHFLRERALDYNLVLKRLNEIKNKLEENKNGK